MQTNQPNGRSSLPPRRTLGVLIVLIVAGVPGCLYLLYLYGSQESPGWFAKRGWFQEVSNLPADKPFRFAAVDEDDRNPGYVGPGQCARCHKERVKEFLLTNHARTCRVPLRDEMPAAVFDGRNTYQTRIDGTKIAIEWDNDHLYQATIRDTAIGRLKQKTRIDLILGAGTADDVYLAWHDNGQMFELPVAWLWPFDQWGASHFLHAAGTGDFSRQMTVRCLECHNTWMQHTPGTVNEYRRDTAVHGVTCERCHGPAADHISYHDEHPEDQNPHHVIQPAKLSRERLIEVCTQCHSNAVTHRNESFSYRPGGVLEETYRTHTISFPEDDHVANQIDGLRQSPCFQNSETMSCVTCHDPHRKPDSSESPSHSCRQCHEPDRCGEQAEIPEPIRGDCVACHMPKRIKINVKFETETDNFVPPASRFRHRIAVDPIARNEVVLKWLNANPSAENQQERTALEAANVDYWVSEADRHEKEHRIMAAIADLREAVAVSERPELKERLRRVVETQERLYLEWSKTLTEISSGDYESAANRLKWLIEQRPTDAEFHSKLGTIYAMQGQSELAKFHLNEVHRLDANNPSGHGVLGRLYFLQGDFSAAAEHWRAALELDPVNTQTMRDLAAALREIGQVEEADRLQNRAGDRPFTGNR
ncbi:MAG: tetratricopeptide repeat protein [Planctomyces sp.]|nr:tetratricopeptide repeat protein [Planctomyces sp.]